MYHRQKTTLVFLVIFAFQTHVQFSYAGFYQRWSKVPFETRLLLGASLVGGGWLYYKFADLQQQLEESRAEREQLKSDIQQLGRDWINAQDALKGAQEKIDNRLQVFTENLKTFEAYRVALQENREYISGLNNEVGNLTTEIKTIHTYLKRHWQAINENRAVLNEHAISINELIQCYESIQEKGNMLAQLGRLQEKRLKFLEKEYANYKSLRNPATNSLP